MTCSGCSAVNGVAAKFCCECGSRLSPAACTACGTPSTGGRFCSECGAPLAGIAPGVGPPPERVAERRLTSVLFADLVGFTTLSEASDPEQVRELLSRYFAEARTVVLRYGGTVEKFIGDAVMAVWGVPVAHEDDAERCVRAGLDLVEMVVALGAELGSELALRVGVVTGEVAVTLGATGQGMVAGDAVNSAARVQAAATAGSVWVDDSTRRLTESAVDYVDQGQHELKGKAAPMTLFQARRVAAGIGGAQRVDGLEAPFIGRERELRLVKELFHATEEDGRPRMVLVAGTAGSGKSRLGWEFEKYIDGLTVRVRWHRGRCLAYGEGVAFWALSEVVRSRLGLGEGGSETEVDAGLAAGLAELAVDDQERSWLRSRLAVLLGVHGGAVYPREDLFAAWTAFLQHVGQGQFTVALLIEDLQHADDGLLDFVEHALGTAQFPLFVLGLSRPELAERRQAVGTGRRATTIHLEALPDGPMAALVDSLVADLPSAARAGLVERAEGVPLYAIETVRALIDRDAVVAREGRYVLADPSGALDLLSVGAPPSLQALISSRLDALTSRERSLVQDAAVLGSSFSREGLDALGDRPDVKELLAALMRKEILTPQVGLRSVEQGHYRFVQAVVRQVAYDTLSRRDRKSRHLAVAMHLEAEAGPDLDAVIAEHYLDAVRASSPDDTDDAALLDQARTRLGQAARRAVGLGSPGEALRHYRAAAALPGGEQARAGLLEGAAAAAGLTGDADTEHDLAAEAVALYRAAGCLLDAARAASFQGEALVRRGEATAAAALLAPMFEELDEQPGAEAVVLALAEVLAGPWAATGDRASRQRYLERTLLLAEAMLDYPRLVRALTSWGITWLSEGSPTAGLAMLNEAVAVARRQQLPSALMRPLFNLSAFHGSRDLGAAIDEGEESVRLAEQSGDRPMAQLSAVNLGLALWTAGRWDELTALFDRIADFGVVPSTAAGIRAWVSVCRGEPTEPVPPSLRDFDSSEDPLHRVWCLLVLALEQRGADPALAADLAGRSVRLAFESAGLQDDFPYMWSWAVELAVASGHEVLAEELIELVSLSRPGLVNALCAAELPRLQALLAELRSGPDQERLLRLAVERLDAFGAVFAAAKARLSLGRLLVGEGRQEEGAACLERAGEVFVRLVARPFRDQVEAAGAAVLLTVT